MKAFFSEIRGAIVSTLVLAVVCCGFYPLVVFGIGQVAFREKANGSLITVGGRVVGSEIIGQNFSKPEYFHPRPSATQGQDPAHPDDSSKTVDTPYNAANSVGSNLGPTSQKLIDRVKADIEAKRKAGATGPIPADSVTTSASGLDPHISPENAFAQVAGVAKARGLPEDKVHALVADHVQGRVLGLIGEPRVNVLELNLALDGLAAS